MVIKFTITKPGLEIDKYKETLMIIEKCKIKGGFPCNFWLCCKIYLSPRNAEFLFAIFAKRNL